MINLTDGKGIEQKSLQMIGSNQFLYKKVQEKSYLKKTKIVKNERIDLKIYERRLS